MKRLILLLLLAAPAGDDWAEFRKLAGRPDFAARCRAVEKIRKYRNTRMVELLVPLLADDHPRVVYLAVRALGRTTDPEGVALLEEALRRHRDRRVRRGAAEALGRLHRETSLAPLLEA
ncbi:MAG: HEAT repeat domain-containing protein, partial [Planctomycetota bacterium]